MNNQSSKKYDAQYHVAYKSFPGKHLFAVSAKIEMRKIENRNIFADTVFLEFTEDFSSGGNAKVAMKVTSHDLRSMYYAIRELLKHGKSSYRKFTDPVKAGNTGTKNELTFGMENKENKSMTYYLNYLSGTKRIGCGYDAYSMTSLSDALLLIAEETDKALFYYQRS